MGESRVLLGVSGGIAAYKACEVCRLLQKAGFDVTVAMTEAAARFVGPLTFEALTGHPVAQRMFDDAYGPSPHIALAQSCDAFLIAPATAHTLAKLACGLADDVVSAAALALPPDVALLVAPAMNVHMYESAATQANLATLRTRGVRVVDAESGYLACGDVGCGRLAAPEALVAAVNDALGLTRQALTGLKVMVTAGPTQEPLDAVRFISNRSSGKMGYALAEAASRRGADVVLVTGPVALEPPSGVKVVAVETAEEMLAAAEAEFPQSALAIFTAAVADYRPAAAATTKLKKGRDDERLAMIELTPNPDILATLAASAKPGQVVVGFAAETEDVLSNGRQKLESKGADMVVANVVGEGRGFGTDDNEAVLIWADAEEELPSMSKRLLAEKILDKAYELYER